MKKKSLFRRVSGVLTGLFFSTSLILAANENGQLFGSETLIVVVALLLFFVPLFLYVRKLHSNMNDRSDRIIKENAALENLNKEINARNEEVNTRNEELDSLNRSLEGQIEQQEERYRALREQNDDLAQANNDLVRKNNELELTISTLNNNKKELEQLIVTKIKENDTIQREAADKLAEAEKRLKDAESINDNFLSRRSMKCVPRFLWYWALLLWWCRMMIRRKTCLPSCFPLIVIRLLCRTWQTS